MSRCVYIPRFVYPFIPRWAFVPSLLSVVDNTAVNIDVLHSILRSKSLNLVHTQEVKGCGYREVGSSQTSVLITLLCTIMHQLDMYLRPFIFLYLITSKCSLTL